MLEHRFAAGQVKLPRRVVLAVEEVDPGLELLVHATALEPRERRPREHARDDQEVRDRVAIDVERPAVALLEVQDLATMVEPGGDQVGAFEERDRLAQIRQIVFQGRREPDTLQPEQPRHALHPAHEVFAQHATIRAAHQDDRRDRGRVRHHGPADPLHEGVSELVHELALVLLEHVTDLGRRDLTALQRLEALALSPERPGEGDRLAEGDVHRTEAPLEILPRPQEPEHALLGLLAAIQLLDHPRLLDQPLVAHRDRDEEEVLAAGFQERVDVPGEHAQPRREGLARARAPALDEELLGEALAHEVSDVGPEDLLVEGIVEGLAQEERAHVPEQVPEGAEGHVLAGRDVGRHEVVLVEEPGQDQEVEVRAVARHEHDRVPLRVLGDLLQAVDLDRCEEALEDSADGGGADSEPRRVHVCRDLLEDLLDLALRLLRGAAVGARPHRHRRAHPRVAEHFPQHAPTRPQRRTLDDLLLAIEMDQHRAPDLAREPLRVVFRVHQPIEADVDLVPDLDREAPVRGQEARDLREVRRSGQRTIIDVQEAVLRPRTLPPEEREGDDEDLTLRIDLAYLPHDLAEQLELVAPTLVLSAAQEGLQTLGAQEKEETVSRGDVLADDLAVLGVLDLPRPCALQAEHHRQQLVERPVVVEVDRVGEAREPQAVSQEERIEEKVVEPARVAHHVDDTAPGLEGFQALHDRLVELEVLEEAVREGAEEQVEARRHRRARSPLCDARRKRRRLTVLRGVRDVTAGHSPDRLWMIRHRAAGYRCPLGPPNSGARGPTKTPGANSARSGRFDSRRVRSAHSGRRISPAAIFAPISAADQRPPSFSFVIPSAVTTRISAIRPPPARKVFPVRSFASSDAR